MSGEQPRQMLLSARSNATSSGERGVSGFDGSRGTSPALGWRCPVGACAYAPVQSKAADSMRVAQLATRSGTSTETLQCRIRLVFRNLRRFSPPRRKAGRYDGARCEPMIVGLELHSQRIIAD